MEHQPQQPQQHGQNRGRRNKYQATGRGMRDRSGAASSWLASPDTQPQHPESYTPAPGHKSPTEQSTPPGLSQQESPAKQHHPPQQQQQQFPHPHQMQQAPEGHQYGLVAAVKESFAFLRAPNRQEHIFFHRSALQLDRKPDWGKDSLLTLLTTGSEVEFELGPSQQDPRKMVGVWVKTVPRGTSRGLSLLQDGLSGVVARELSGQQRRPQEGYGGKISFVRPSGAQEGTPSSQQNGVRPEPDGAASPEPAEADEPTSSTTTAGAGEGAGAGTPGEEQTAGFDGSEVHPSAGRLSVGDRVKFDLAQQTLTGELVALNVRLQQKAPRPETLRLLGCVVTLKDGFGFVRPAERPGERIYFRFNDVAAGQQQLLALNAEVSFQMAPDPYDNADRASKLQVMTKQFDPSRLKMQGGSGVGRIVQAASAEAAAGTQDGVLSLQEGRDTLHVSFGAAQVEGDDELQQGAEVEFFWGQQPETGALKATSVKLRAQVQQEGKLELGQVSSMRQAFGFLRCVERPGELFFHFSQCATPAEELHPGDDVEFAMTREPKGHRLNAVRVRKVAPGSAVFDVVSEETLEGVVKEAALPPRGYNQLPTSGVLSYQDGEGEEHLIPYGLGDLKERGLSPCPGDGVTFRISTHLATAKAAEKSDAAAAKHAGRRAVQVAPQPHHGLVAVLQETFGLVEYSPNLPYVKEVREGKQRIRFNPTDLQKGLTVRLSDEVSFVVVEDRGSKEKRARKIQLIKEGDGVVPDFEDKNPNPMKFVGSQQNAGAKANFKVRIARGPDGTRGFTAELQPGNRAALLPPPAPEPEADVAELDEGAGEEDTSGHSVSANGAKSDGQAGARIQQQPQPRGQTTNKEKGKRNKRAAQDRQGPRNTAPSPGLPAASDTAASAEAPFSAAMEGSSPIAAEPAQPVQLLRKSSSLNPLASAFVPAGPTPAARRRRLIVTAQVAATQPKMQSAHDIGGSIVGKHKIPVDNVDVLCMYGDLCQTTYDNFWPDANAYKDPRTHEERRWRLTPSKLLGPHWRAYRPDMNKPPPKGATPDEPPPYCNVPDKSLARSLNYQVVDNDSDVYYITATSGWEIGGPVLRTFFDTLLPPIAYLRTLLRTPWRLLMKENSVDSSNWIGYVAVSEPKDNKRDLVVAWRGTQAITEWETDMTARLVDWGVRENQVVPDRSSDMYQVHEGFSQLYRAFDETPGSTLSVQGQVQCAVRKLLAKYPGEIATITTTGHSLGGALASLSAFDLWSSFCNRPGDLPISYGHPPKAWPADSPKNPYGSEPIPIRACSFEAPLVGNQLYANAFNMPGLSMVRVVNKGDLVPEVPRGSGFLADMSTLIWGILWAKFNIVPSASPWRGDYYHGGVLKEVDASKYADKWKIRGGDNHQLPLVLYCLDPSRPYQPPPEKVSLVSILFKILGSPFSST